MKKKHDAFDVVDALRFIIFAGCMLFVIIAILISGYRAISVGLGRKTEVVATVTDKGIKNDSNESGKYLVFIESDDPDLKVLQVTDNLFAMRFNSSDVYGGIKIGKTYKFTTRGSRNRLFSWYPNIYEYEEVE